MYRPIPIGSSSYIKHRFRQLQLHNRPLHRRPFHCKGKYKIKMEGITKSAMGKLV